MPPDAMPSLIHTFSGLFVDPLNLDPADVRIEDIVHALSNQCRFSGHTSRFYSVGQHCVIVSLTVPPEFAFDGLLHDAPEYVLQDMAKPLKNHPALGQAYRGAEKRIERVIAEVFGVRFPHPPEVKAADIRALVTEARDLMHGTSDWPYYQDIEPLPETIRPWSPKEAERRFLARYAELRRKEEGE